MFDFKSLIPTFSQREKARVPYSLAHFRHPWKGKEFFEFLEIPINKIP
jgi:hypothetical protein